MPQQHLLVNYKCPVLIGFLKYALPDLDLPCVVARDFNILNHTAHPLRVISRSEEQVTAPYYDRATDLAFNLFNSPGDYTYFLVEGQYRPSVIDLAFANSLIYSAVISCDSISIPLTGSNHVPLMITLNSPTTNHTPPRPM